MQPFLNLAGLIFLAFSCSLYAQSFSTPYGTVSFSDSVLPNTQVWVVANGVGNSCSGARYHALLALNEGLRQLALLCDRMGGVLIWENAIYGTHPFLERLQHGYSCQYPHLLEGIPVGGCSVRKGSPSLRYNHGEEAGFSSELSCRH